MSNDNTTGELKFRSDSALYKLNFERYYRSDQIEKIKVFGKEKEIHLQSDRPTINNQKKKRAPKWKILGDVKPEIYSQSPFLAQLIYVLESILDEIDNGKGPSYQEYLKNKKSW